MVIRSGSPPERQNIDPFFLSKNPAFGDQLVLAYLLLTRVIALAGTVAEANPNLRAAPRGTGLAGRDPNANGATGTSARGPGRRRACFAR